MKKLLLATMICSVVPAIGSQKPTEKIHTLGYLVPVEGSQQAQPVPEYFGPGRDGSITTPITKEQVKKSGNSAASLGSEQGRRPKSRFERSDSK